MHNQLNNKSMNTQLHLIIKAEQGKVLKTDAKKITVIGDMNYMPECMRWKMRQ